MESISSTPNEELYELIHANPPFLDALKKNGIQVPKNEPNDSYFKLLIKKIKGLCPYSKATALDIARNFKPSTPNSCSFSTDNTLTISAGVVYFMEDIMPTDQTAKVHKLIITNGEHLQSLPAIAPNMKNLECVELKNDFDLKFSITNFFRSLPFSSNRRFELILTNQTTENLTKITELFAFQISALKLSHIPIVRIQRIRDSEWDSFYSGEATANTLQYVIKMLNESATVITN